ncbi:S-layer homology domain-containing protein [Deinococcus enclensis]|uniref:DNA-directed RNA polymerase subunit K/omega n=1 Tax=Deinococcus enclensis TaxID=1049582 RepID=A0ABT9MEC4_9DEIO|nr:S-layer homology domain-containing protein [Deinococcus enclensis]MDP9764948.1 DNA-directed RNA polymerase subunit K/omega [Deinococcus enclensis]
MKKGLLILTAALTFGSMAAAQTTATSSAPQVPALTDVPAGHWAKDAIDKLVSRGIILGYPDGTFRGTQNLTRYEAAVIIARLLDQMRSGEVAVDGIDQEVLTALQNAVQELAADLAALGVRVTDLEENMVSKEDFARLEERVNALGAVEGDPTALQGITDQLAALNTSVDELTANYDTLRADVDDNASNIAALNDLTVLLNQDILDLQDRVSAVEAAQSDFVLRADFDNLTNRVAGIDTRVTNLEKAPKFSVTGNINTFYGRIGLVQGTTNFDVDRLTNYTFASGVFSTGDFCQYTNSTATTVDGVTTVTPGATGRLSAVRCADTQYGSYTQDSSATFGVSMSNLTTANGAMTVNSATLNFGVANLFNIAGGDTNVRLNSANANGTLAGQAFTVAYHRSNSKFKFNDLLFANDADDYGATTRRGAVFTVQANQLWGQPLLTVVLGDSRTRAGENILNGNYYGVRLATQEKRGDTTVDTFGVSFAQNDGNRSALGVDFDKNFGGFNVRGIGVLSSPIAPSLINDTAQNVWNAADKGAFVEVTGDLGPVAFGVNARAVDADYANGVAGMSGNYSVIYANTNGTAPYAGQIGAGAGFGTKLGIIALGAYADTYSDYDDTVGEDRNTAFGVAAAVQFNAFKLGAFYNYAAQNNEQVTSDPNMYSGTLTDSYMGVANVPFMYSSFLGAYLTHDGAAANALVKGLNLTLFDAYNPVSEQNSFAIYGDYSGNLGGFTVNPLFRFATDSLEGDTISTTAKYGVRLSTPTLTSVPLEPSAYINFANRITNPDSGIQVQNTTTTELLGQVGVKFNQFLAPNATAAIGYSYYQGFNVAGVTALGTTQPFTTQNVGTTNAAFNAASNNLYAARGTNNAKLDGIFTQVGWNGLTANYGVFRYWDLSVNNTATPTSTAHGFKVGYSFKF